MSLIFRNLKRGKQIICSLLTQRHLITDSSYINQFNNHSFKFKHTKSSNYENDSDSDFDEDSNLDLSSLIKVESLRNDLVLKTALGISRKKLELLFYDNKIMLNDQILSKKSKRINKGDIIDVVKEPYYDNPKLMIVSRVEIGPIKFQDEKFHIKVHKFKSHIIEIKNKK